ncbi:MAG TPA: autotransporter-associated beta strand repeat-containing protein, partial [Pirellulales bacterium]|nr:autotransporter-associated beta strand repeat-containing protein [Pirellulales bacterium]
MSRILPLAWAAVAMVAAINIAAPAARAANGSWLANPGDNNWIPTSGDTNWSGVGQGVNTFPGAGFGTANTDIATFNVASPTLTVTLPSHLNIAGLTFDTAAGGYTFQTGAFFLTSGGTIQIASTLSAAQTETFSTAINLEGNYTFTDANTTAGTLLLFNGPISLDTGTASSTLTVNGAGNTTINGAISNGGATLGLTMSGTGTLALGSATNSFTGATLVSSGFLQYNVAGSQSTSAITVNAAGTVVAGAGFTNPLAGLAPLISAGSTGTLALGANDSEAFTPGAAIVLGAANGTSVTYSGTITPAAAGYLFGGNSSGTLTVSSAQGGASALTKSGASNTVVLSGANTYTGVTSINAGILNAGIAEVAGTSGPFGKQAANAVNTIVFGGGTLQYSAANNNDYSGRFSTAANQPISIDTTGRNVTFASVLSSAGGTLNKLGGGTLTLAAANTYTGATTLSGGILNAGFAEVAGTSGPLGKSAAANTGNIVFNGGTLQYSAANNNDYSGRFSTAANQAYKIDVNGRSVAFATALTSAGGSLTESSTIAGGALTLSAANTYTGGTTLNSGTLALNFAETAGTSGPLGKSAAANPGNIILGGGTLQYTAANQFDYSGRFSTAASQLYNVDVNGQSVTWATALTSAGGSLTLSSTAAGGTLALSGANTFA